jgi:dolichyl-phosphate-mannose--protein O-mannosyl transferase
MKSETIYTIIIVALAAIGGFFLAPGRELALTDIVLVKFVSVATFLALAVGMLAALRGVKYNVLAEVFDENNTAGAIFAGLLLVSIALVVGK